MKPALQQYYTRSLRPTLSAAMSPECMWLSKLHPPCRTSRRDTYLHLPLWHDLMSSGDAQTEDPPLAAHKCDSWDGYVFSPTALMNPVDTYVLRVLVLLLRLLPFAHALHQPVIQLTSQETKHQKQWIRTERQYYEALRQQQHDQLTMLMHSVSHRHRGSPQSAPPRPRVEVSSSFPTTPGPPAAAPLRGWWSPS